MVSEKIIDNVIDQFEAGKVDYEQAFQDFGKQQPAILSYLLSDHEGAFTDGERDFLLYLAVVIWQSIEASGLKPAKVNVPVINGAEEANWEMMSESKGKTFRDRLDVFFEDSPQEDLLAFIEDSLTLDEVNDGSEVVKVTEEGVEPMFVILKTVVDVLA